MKSFPLYGTLSLALFGFLLSACIPVLRSATSGPAFVPPTPLSAAPPTASASPTSGSSDPAASILQPTPDAPCQDNLVFRADVTIPDGTSVQPDATLDKRWEVENSGSCNWQENYRVRLIAGSEMSAQPEQALYPARSGTRAVIRIVFKAPPEPGDYRSAWQAFNPQGEPFGDPFFIEILVE